MAYFWTVLVLYALSGAAIIALLVGGRCPSWIWALVALHVLLAVGAVVVGLIVTERDEDK